MPHCRAADSSPMRACSELDRVLHELDTKKWSCPPVRVHEGICTRARNVKELRLRRLRHTAPVVAQYFVHANLGEVCVMHRPTEVAEAVALPEP
eukprot:scaffold476_cov111-Isochrysis_galbana.AAC.5